MARAMVELDVGIILFMGTEMIATRCLSVQPHMRFSIENSSNNEEESHMRLCLPHLHRQPGKTAHAAIYLSHTSPGSPRKSTD
jgi:hypothetical protein